MFKRWLVLLCMTASILEIKACYSIIAISGNYFTHIVIVSTLIPIWITCFSFVFHRIVLKCSGWTHPDVAPSQQQVRGFWVHERFWWFHLNSSPGVAVFDRVAQCLDKTSIGRLLSRYHCIVCSPAFGHVISLHASRDQTEDYTNWMASCLLQEGGLQVARSYLALLVFKFDRTTL